MKWFRFYHDARHDPKVRRLPDRLFRHWVNILCIASANKPRGMLPTVPDVADELRVSVTQAAEILQQLRDAKLLDETRRGLMPHNWPKRQPLSDNAAERMRNKRRTSSEHVQPLARASRPNSASASISPSDSLSQESGTKRPRPSSRKVTSYDKPPSPILALLANLYENEVGSMSPTIDAELRDWCERIPDNERGHAGVLYAFRESAAQGKRTWKYIAAILARLEAADWPADPGAAGLATLANEGAEWLADRYERAKGAR